MAVSTTVVDSAFIYIAAFGFLLLAGIIFTMLYFLVRYRRARNPQPTEFPGNTPLEATWIVLSVLLVLTMFFYGLTGFRFLRRPPPDSLRVKVIARQWSWQFVYDNGITSSDLVAPLGRNVRAELNSEDVIHGFFVPAFRIKQDTVPGMKTQAWFRATQLGTFDILCSQYCGQRHSAMLSRLIVVPPEQFDQWYGGQPVQIAGLAPPTREPKGEELLRQKGCLACHSLDGSPLVGPSFKGLFGRTVEVLTEGRRRTVTADEAYIRLSILDPHDDVVVGYPDIMQKGLLSEAEVQEMLKYIEQLK